MLLVFVEGFRFFGGGAARFSGTLGAKGPMSRGLFFVAGQAQGPEREASLLEENSGVRRWGSRPGFPAFSVVLVSVEVLFAHVLSLQKGTTKRSSISI